MRAQRTFLDCSSKKTSMPKCSFSLQRKLELKKYSGVIGRKNIISNLLFDLIVNLCIYMYIKKTILSVVFNQIRIHRSLCTM